MNRNSTCKAEKHKTDLILPVDRKNKRYAWHGVAVTIAGFDEQGALVIDELMGYRDQLLKGLSAKAPRQGIKVEFSVCPMKVIQGRYIYLWKTRISAKVYNADLRSKSSN